MTKNTAQNRRSFLKLSTSLGGGLILGFNLLSSCETAAEKIVAKSLPENWFDINTFIKIGENGLVTIYSPNPEIGQNVKTSMPMIVAEELNVSWEDVLVEQAPLSEGFTRQVAGGSQSIRKGWDSLRNAGATARQMLMAAAANQWEVSIDKVTAAKGIVSGPEGKTIGYGELAKKAATLEVPTDVKLKDPKDYTIIGNSKTNVDIDDIISGKPLFGIDTKEDGMVYAASVRPPAFGMTLESYDDTAAKSVPGVIDVLRYAGNKIAVLADNTWTAFKAKEKIEANWKESGNLETTAGHDKMLLDLLKKKSKEPRRNDGNVDEAFAKADKIVDKIYEAPFLPHNCLEPMNFFAKMEDGKLIGKGPIQTPAWAQGRISDITNIDKDNIEIMMTRMGGGFGRRLYGDFSDEAAEIAQKSGRSIQLMFSREDDMSAGTYRPASKYRIRAAIKDGEITAYHLTEACINGNMFDSIPNYFPAGSIANMRVDTNTEKSNITTGAWRAPYTNFLAFAEQSFFDELAEEMEIDPIDLRLSLFEKAIQNKDAGYEYDPARAIGVTKMVAEKSGWGKQGENTHLGLSVYYSHNTHVAEVAEVEMKDGTPKIKKVTAVIDCGIVINPKAAINQIEGGIIDGIGHAMYANFVFKDGKANANNFNQYRMIRMNEAPEIAVHFIASDKSPTGLGEPSLPPVGGAIANALYRATGSRLYKQPFINENEILG